MREVGQLVDESATSRARPSDVDGEVQNLSDKVRDLNCTIHAYGLMTNHVHLLASLRDIVQTGRNTLGRRYVAFCFGANKGQGERESAL